MIRETDKLAKNAFDVLIIGGGIYGIAVALETARAGLRTGLIEQTDFSHATSANSLKIIHGGLRYLQHLNIRRMRESIRSRNLMMYSAPHLVRGLGCIMPTYGHGLKGKEVMAFALLLNDLIGLDRNHAIDKRNHLPRGKIIPKDQCLKMFPNIEEDGLTGGCLWYDALALNSERLALTFLLESIKHGALAANYVEANKLKIDDGRVIGVSARDLLSNKDFDIQAKTIVNATGPWLENILGSSLIKTGKKKSLARAMNLITKKRLCQDKALGLEGSESYLDNDAILNRGKRLYFFVPWRGYTMIGTDYKLYHGEAGEIRVTIDDIKELVEEINRIYPSASLTLEDITFYHAGLVPIEHMQTGSDDIQLDKCSQIIDHEKENNIKGLYSIKGIKYTTAVETAKKVLKRILHSTKTPENFRNHYLSHTKENSAEDTAAKYQEYKNQNGALRRHFESIYGESCAMVFKYIESNKDEQSLISLNPPLTKGEVRYFVREEMAVKLPDVVFRRTGLGSAECPAYEILKETADVMAEELGWSSEKKYEEIEAVISRYSPLKSAEIVVRKQ